MSFAPFHSYPNPNVCQDRLGKNIGKVEATKRDVLAGRSLASVCIERLREEGGPLDAPHKTTVAPLGHGKSGDGNADTSSIECGSTYSAQYWCISLRI